jgi:GNAT superfamily N-acetyltransferase
MRQIRQIGAEDMSACAELLMDAYNRGPWHNRWTAETAERYLSEILKAQRFRGLLMEEDGRAVGAAFCHGRTWWTADELYVDEFFIASDMQRKGLGGELLQRVEEYARAEGLAGVTLLTNRHFPARDFYLKHGYAEAVHVLFMYKTV